MLRLMIVLVIVLILLDLMVLIGLGGSIGTGELWLLAVGNVLVLVVGATIGLQRRRSS